MTRVAIRGYAAGAVLFDDLAVLNSRNFSNLLLVLAQKHCAVLAAHELHMVELEFLDDPDRNHRFIRFGTDLEAILAARLSTCDSSAN